MPNPTASMKRVEKDAHTPKGTGKRRELFSLWKQKFYREVIHKNRTFSFYRKFFPSKLQIAVFDRKEHER